MADVNVNFPPAPSPNRGVSAGDVDAAVLKVKADVEGQVSEVAARLEETAKKSEIQSLVTNKADKTEVRENTDIKPINVSEMDTETKQLFTGGAVAVVGVDAVGKENLKTKSVTSIKIANEAIGYKKTTFLKEPNNLFNANNTIDQGISSSTGLYYATSTYISALNYLEVDTSQTYVMAYINRIGKYDENYNFLGSVDLANAETTQTFAANVKHILLSTYATNKNRAQFSKGSVLPPYEPYYLNVKDIKILPTDTNFVNQFVSANLFNQTFESGLISNIGDQVVTTATADVYSAVIPIENGESYSIIKELGGNRFTLMLTKEDPRLKTPVDSVFAFRGTSTSVRQTYDIRNTFGANFLFLLTNSGSTDKPLVTITKKSNKIDKLLLDDGSVTLNKIGDDVKELLNSDNSNTQKFFFAPETLNGSYVAKTGTYTPISTIANLYTAYDALQSANPTYITKRLLGNDASGTIPIYEYRFKPSITTGTSRNHPKILTHAGIHGGEEPSVYTLYYVLKNICEDWKNDKLLEYLRWNIDFIVIPCINVWGFEPRIRENANGVNIQKNPKHNGAYAGESDAGPNAWSEPEAQYIRNMILDNPDAFYYCDIHSAGTGDVPGSLMLHGLPGGVVYDADLDNSARYNIEKMTREFQKNYSLPYDGTILGNITQTYTGSTRSYASSLGMKASAVETFYRLPNEASANSTNTLKANCEFLANWFLTLINQHKAS